MTHRVRRSSRTVQALWCVADSRAAVSRSVGLVGSGILPMSRRSGTNGTLTRAALAGQVADAAGLTKKRAEIVVDNLFSSIAEALHQDEKVELRGFGSFRLRRREPRRGRNPRTGDRVNVPSKRIAFFKPGKELKELINRDPE